MSGWQDIATAPNDGEHVLVMVDGFTYLAYQDVFGWRVFSGQGDDDPVLEHPTHWMPLPEPPWREHVIEMVEEGEMRPEP